MKTPCPRECLIDIARFRKLLPGRVFADDDDPIAGGFSNLLQRGCRHPRRGMLKSLAALCQDLQPKGQALGLTRLLV
jgi:hypothetical protein